VTTPAIAGTLPLERNRCSHEPFVSFHSEGSRAQHAKSSTVCTLHMSSAPQTGHGRPWLTNFHSESMAAESTALVMANLA
jgi:hypothetical protein